MQQQTTYADYGVSETTKDENGNIVSLLSHKRDANGTMLAPEWYTREVVINAILRDRITFMTIRISNNQWFQGSDIHVVTMSSGQQYLRTDWNKTPKDNLDEL